MISFKDLPCVICKSLIVLSVFLIGALSVIGVQYLKKEKETEALMDSIKMLEKFKDQSDQKLLAYVSANWISETGDKLISICTHTGYITIEKLSPVKEDIRYKIIGIEEINGVFGFIKFKIQIPKTQDFSYFQVNKLFQVENIVSMSYSSPVDDCKTKLCIEIIN